MPENRVADDFTTIRARMEELRREREGVQSAEGDLQQDPTPTNDPCNKAKKRCKLRKRMGSRFRVCWSRSVSNI
jgi:hypothetical protein